MQKSVKFFVVMLTLFATSAPCFCWVQMVSMPGCHASAEMKDCCCNKDVAVDQDMPARNLAILPAEWQIPQLDMATLVVYNISSTSNRNSSPFKGQGRGSPLRSPPNLYLLHVSFLI